MNLDYVVDVLVRLLETPSPTGMAEGAIDLNPFHNPYVNGDVVLPELASSYLDRDNVRPGMITAEVVAIFTDIGWGWGGQWRSIKDWMHFSDNGR